MKNKHDLNDVRRIVEEYYTQTGDMLQMRYDMEALKVAEQRFNEGMWKLQSLHLSKEDKKGMHLIRLAFQHATASMQHFQKGNDHVALGFMRKASMAVDRYIRNNLLSRGVF